MELQLESLKYQDLAVQSGIKSFEGTEKAPLIMSFKALIQRN